MGRSTPLNVVGGAILRGRQCLVAQRGPTMRDAGKWEFPGGKIEAGETPVQALVRELTEELGVVVEVGDHVARGVEGRITLDVYVARIVEGEPEAAEHAALRWLRAPQLLKLDWAAPDVPIAAALAALLVADDFSLKI